MNSVEWLKRWCSKNRMERIAIIADGFGVTLKVADAAVKNILAPQKSVVLAYVGDYDGRNEYDKSIR